MHGHVSGLVNAGAGLCFSSSNNSGLWCRHWETFKILDAKCDWTLHILVYSGTLWKNSTPTGRVWSPVSQLLGRYHTPAIKLLGRAHVPVLYASGPHSAAFTALELGLTVSPLPRAGVCIYKLVGVWGWTLSACWIDQHCHYSTNALTGCSLPSPLQAVCFSALAGKMKPFM